jgi:hypothetical protein
MNPGIRLRMPTPPEIKYRKGKKGLMRSIENSGNSDSNRARSRTNTIQGSAPFAPESGPLAGNDQSCASG